MEYRVNMREETGSYYIQMKVKSFLFWHKWENYGQLSGSAGYIGKITSTFDTKEKAIEKIIELVAREKNKKINAQKVADKVKDFEPIDVSSKDIREKFPQYFL